MILGLDISTSITGYTILDYNGNILACDHIDMRKVKNFFDKIQMVNNHSSPSDLVFHPPKLSHFYQKLMALFRGYAIIYSTVNRSI